MSVTVVIPTHNRHAGLAGLLDDLRRQVGTEPPEVLVINSAEGEPVDDVVDEAYADGLDVVGLLADNSAAAKRNAGAAAARGELLCLLDDDMRVPPGWLAAHVAAHADGVERCVGGAVHFPDEWVARSNFYRFKQGQHRNDDSAELTPLPAHRVITMNMSIPRATWLRVGGNDTEFRRYGGEDVEFGFRLVAAGVPLELSRAAWAWHEEVRIDAVAWARKLYVAAYEGAPLVLAKAPQAASVRTFRWTEPGLQVTAGDRVAHAGLRALARPGVVVRLARRLRAADADPRRYDRRAFQALTALVNQLAVDDRVAGRANRADELFG